MKGYAGWISIKILPLDYWCRQTFEAIGAHYGGLENIASGTLNLLNCSEAKIQVKKNLCGFMPSTIEIKDGKQGNIFLNFGDIEIIDPLSKVKGALFTRDFTNHIDVVRLNQVMKDEGINSSFKSIEMDYLKSI